MALDPVLIAAQSVLAAMTGIDVIIDDQRGPRLHPPFISIRIITDRFFPDSTRWSGTREGRLSVQIFGDGIWETAQKIRTGLETQTYQDDLDDYNVTLTWETGESRRLGVDSDRVADNRILLELSYSALWSTTEPTTSTIDTVERTPTYD